jgi:uncharacterized membrane protein
MRKTQEQIDISMVIVWVLQGGIVISSTIILLGMVLLMLRQGGLATIQLQSFPATPDQIWAGLLAFQPLAIIVLGLLILMVTPVIRVAISVFAFGLEHDRAYVSITLVVLAILCIGFLLGKGGA